MATYIGKCLYCEDGTVEYESKQVRGKKTKVYCCSNNKVTTVDDGDTWEPTADSTCSWKLFGSNLERWGKKFIGPKEVKKLLAGDEVIAHMYSYVKKVEYKKYLTISEEYGVSVLWEMDVEEDEDSTEKKPYKKAYPQKEYSKKKKIEPEEEIEYSPIVDPIKKEFVKRAFVKPVFVNKKHTDEGAAF